MMEIRMPVVLVVVVHCASISTIFLGGSSAYGDEDASKSSNVSRKCPSQCICHSDSQVSCYDGDLNGIIYALPRNVTHLSLTKSHIAHVKSESFADLKNLSKLSLDDNNITRIHQFAFKGLRKLRELSIQHTTLDKLEKFVFSGLQNVTAILLAHNRISVVEAFAFAGTSHVRIILLAHNPLHVIKSSAFSGLRNVEHLILPSGIKHIRPDAFNGLDSVGLVKLAFMDLNALEAHTFRGLNHVHLLAIQESDLGTIKARAFDGLTNVGTLNLINNKIDHLQEFAIKRENNVKILRLVGNHILKVPASPRFIRVQVSDNFTVVGNHFPCSCVARWLTGSGSALANRTSYNFSSTNYCISPLQVNGKPINQMSNARCDQQSSSSVYFDLDSWNLAVSSPLKQHDLAAGAVTRPLYYLCFILLHYSSASNALYF